MTGGSTNWRAPRRGDDAAWASIETGQWLTEPDTIAARGHGDRARARGGPKLAYAVRSVRAPESWVSWWPRRTPTVTDDVKDVYVQLEDDPGADAVRALAPFARHANADVREVVAWHPRTPPVLLSKLLTDANPVVRAGALTHPDAVVPQRQLRSAARCEHAVVRLAAAKHPQASASMLATLLTDRDDRVVRAAAHHPRTRLKDLLGVPLAAVPTGRLPEAICSLVPSAAQGSATARALTLVGELGGGVTLRDALVTVGAVLT